MISINNNVVNEIVIKNSKFITYLLKLNNIAEVENILTEIKRKKKEATHYCYAYIFDNTKRFSDDGEPSKTAGMPILNVLESNKLNHILAVTVRYFGGTKLGAGGLVRAYTNSITEALKKTDIVNFIECLSFDISFDHKQKSIIDSLTKNITIKNKIFADNINYTIIISKENCEMIIDKLNQLNIKIENIEEIYIEKAKI